MTITNEQRRSLYDSFRKAAGVSTTDGSILQPALDALDRVAAVTRRDLTDRDRGMYQAGVYAAHCRTRRDLTDRDRGMYQAGVYAAHCRTPEDRTRAIAGVLSSALGDVPVAVETACGFTPEERAALEAKGVNVGAVDFTGCKSEAEYRARLAEHRATTGDAPVSPPDFSGCRTDGDAREVLAAHAAKHGLEPAELLAKLRDSHDPLTSLWTADD